MTFPIFANEERQHSPSVFQLAGASRTGRLVDFCYLSNKFFPTDALLAELAADFAESVRNYPSMHGEQSELAAVLTGYPAERILVGNGASELIHLVAARLGRRWMMPYPSYMEYENVLREFKKELICFQLREEEDFKVDIDRVLHQARQEQVDAIVLPNPNSPTGQKISQTDLCRLLEEGAHLKSVVIDESFIEFTALAREQIPTLRSFLERYPQLIIIRSLGKDFGVCGLRLGLMATADPQCLSEIRRFLPIWNISPSAEKFLRLCARHMEDYERMRVTCIEETQRLSEGLRQIPQLKVFETFSNFILFKILPDGISSTALRDHLLSEYGFYVRDCSRKLGLGDKFVRVGTNLPAENARLVSAIADFVRRG